MVTRHFIYNTLIFTILEHYLPELNTERSNWRILFPLFDADMDKMANIAINLDGYLKQGQLMIIVWRNSSFGFIGKLRTRHSIYKMLIFTILEHYLPKLSTRGSSWISFILFDVWNYYVNLFYLFICLVFKKQLKMQVAET